MPEREQGSEKGRGTRGVRLWEAIALAVIVGAASYFAGMRNGVKTEQRRAERAMTAASPHGEAMGGMGMGSAMGTGASDDTGAPSMPPADKESFKASFAGASHEKLVEMGDSMLSHMSMEGAQLKGDDAKQMFTMAAAAYEKALEMKPHDPSVLAPLGLALHGMGDDKGAKAAWEEYLNIAPKDDSARKTVEDEMAKLKAG